MVLNDSLPGYLIESPRGPRCSMKHGGSPVVPARSGANAVFCVAVSLIPEERGNQKSLPSTSLEEKVQRKQRVLLSSH